MAGAKWSYQTSLVPAITRSIQHKYTSTVSNIDFPDM